MSRSNFPLLVKAGDGSPGCLAGAVDQLVVRQNSHNTPDRSILDRDPDTQKAATRMWLVAVRGRGIQKKGLTMSPEKAILEGPKPDMVDTRSRISRISSQQWQT